jgi:hypothetical protein
MTRPLGQHQPPFGGSLLNDLYFAPGKLHFSGVVEKSLVILRALHHKSIPAVNAVWLRLSAKIRGCLFIVVVTSGASRKRE